MNETVYVSLAVSSHNTARAAEAQFSKVRVTGSVSPFGPFTASEYIRLKLN